jgi:hypothetical protein
LDKAFVAQRLANKVWSAEDAVDTAMSEAGELMAGIMATRRELKFSADVTDGATAKLVEAMAGLSQARTALIAMHAELAVAKLRIGIRTKLTGGVDKPPPPPPKGEEEEDNRIWA